MKIARTLLLTATVAICASCGDYWEAGGDTVPARTMTLERESIDLMVGDSYQIPVSFEPEELPNDAVWWVSDDNDIANFDEGKVVAVSEGTTTAYAISAVDRLEASCTVNVWPRWYDNPYNYPYDMVIYADITIDGEPVDDDVFVGAFCYGELRGVAKKIDDNGRQYTVIRVWSDNESGDLVFFRHYDPATATLKKHSFWVPFITTDTWGTPSSPFQIDLN